jgi:hypothetical protein
VINVIPPLTPSDMFWEQPSADDILIDDEYAIMGCREFQELADLTLCPPEVTRVGMMWKACQCGKDHCTRPAWHLYWWDANELGTVRHERRLILIV